MAHDVFLSYSSEDGEAAQTLGRVLEAAGIRCWIAPRDVIPGQDYAEAIVDAIDQCAIFVLLLSSRSNESPHVRREAERAASKGKRMVPLRIENIAPSKAIQYFIGSSHWLDAISPPYEPKFQVAAQAILRHLGTRLPAPGGPPLQPAAPAAAAPARPTGGRGGMVLAAAIILGAALAGVLKIRAGRVPAATPIPVARTTRLLTPPSGSTSTPDMLDGCAGEYPQEIQRAQQALERGQGVLAARSFQRALEACPRGATAQRLLPQALGLGFEESKRRGDEEARWGRRQNAANAYNDALRLWPGSSDDPEPAALRSAVLKLGQSLTEWGGANPEGCGREYGRNLAWGLSYLSQGRSSSALNSLERASQGCPSGKSAAELLLRAKEARFLELEQKAEAFIRAGQNYRAALEYREALKYWTGSRQDPEYAALQAEITRLEKRR